MTRGEPRPFHITLIATCRVLVPGSTTPGTSRSFSRILLEGFKTRLAVESMFFQSRGTWAVSVVRFSGPRSTKYTFAYRTCAC